MVSVRLRADGRYEARPMFQGRRLSIYGRSEEEVRAKLAEFERQCALNQPPPPGLTLQQACERWIATEQRRWKPRTLADYERLLTRWVYPTIGGVRLSKLSADLLQRTIDRVPGRQASQVYRVLHRCLGMLTRWGFLPQNLCDRVSPPIYRPNRVELPSQEELVRLFKYCMTSEDDYAPLLAFALLTGARAGELLSLKWSDVDLSRGLVEIRRSGQWIRGEWKESLPKTAAGRRTIAIGRLGVQILERQREVVARRQRSAGSKWQEHDLVFPGASGKPLTSDRVSAAMRRLCRQAGVRRMHFHALRHGCASLLLSLGVPLPVASKRLGHANTGITSRIYAHAIAHDQLASEAIERALC